MFPTMAFASSSHSFTSRFLSRPSLSNASCTRRNHYVISLPPISAVQALPMPTPNSKPAHFRHPIPVVPSSLPSNPSTFYYNVKIDKLARKKNSLSRCLCLFKQMRKKNIAPDKYTYSALLKSCTRDNSPETAFQIYHLIRRDGIPLDSHLRSMLLKLVAASPSPRLDLCLRLFNGASRPNRVLCNVLMNAYASSGSVEQCISTFRYMTAASIRPDGYTVSTLIKAYTKANRLDDAVTNLHDIRKSGLDIPPCAFAIIIGAFGEQGDIENAIQMYDLMTKWGIHPNQVTFNVLIRACAHAGDLSLAIQVFEEMKHISGFSGDRYTFHALMQCCLKIRDGRYALYWYHQIGKHNQVSFRLGFIAAGQSFDLDTVYVIENQMDELQISPRCDTLAHLIAACIRCSDLQGASGFFSKYIRCVFNPKDSSTSLYSGFFDEIRNALWSFEDQSESSFGDHLHTIAVVDEMERSIMGKAEERGKQRNSRPNKLVLG